MLTHWEGSRSNRGCFGFAAHGQMPARVGSGRCGYSCSGMRSPKMVRGLAICVSRRWLLRSCPKVSCCCPKVSFLANAITSEDERAHGQWTVRAMARVLVDACRGGELFSSWYALALRALAPCRALGVCVLASPQQTVTGQHEKTNYCWRIVCFFKRCCRNSRSGSRVAAVLLVA